MFRRSIVLGVVVLATATACSDDGDDSAKKKKAQPSTTTSTTSSTTTTTVAPTTTAPTTPATTLAPVTPPAGACPTSRQEAASRILASWAAGDRAGAGACAVPSAVDALFAEPVNPLGYSFYECVPVDNEFRSRCSFMTGGGAHFLTVEQDSENSQVQVIAYEFQGS